MVLKKEHFMQQNKFLIENKCENIIQLSQEYVNEFEQIEYLGKEKYMNK